MEFIIAFEQTPEKKILPVFDIVHSLHNNYFVS